jgi:hypothetical protein
MTNRVRLADEKAEIKGYCFLIVRKWLLRPWAPKRAEDIREGGWTRAEHDERSESGEA